MIKKIQLPLVATLGLISVSSFAGLTLCSGSTNTQPINVVCNGTESPAPIPANGGCATLEGNDNLSWTLIDLAIMHGPTGTCNFYVNGKTTLVGSATVDVNVGTNQGKLTNITYAANYSLDTGSYVPGNYASNITATITQLSQK